MNRLNLDYQRSARPFPWAGLVILGVALALLGGAAFYYRGVNEQIGYWETRAGQVLRARARQSLGSQREIRDAAQEIKRANEVLGQITLPWDKLFQAVEWSAGKDVALLSLEPDADRHEMKIGGEAKNIAAMLGYVGHLSEQRMFTSVYLLNHQVQEQSPDQPVRFALIASWRTAP